MAIDSTIGGQSSNSYVSVAEADAYFGTRLHVDEWTNAETSNKEKALVMATYRLEQEDYDFWRASQIQVLQWPRYGVESPDGVLYSMIVIPPGIKNATFELALTMLQTDFLANTGLSNFRNMSIAGVINLTPRYLSSGNLPDNVQRWLRGYVISSSNVVRLVRS